MTDYPMLPLDEGERWLPVVGFEAYYEISDLGNCRSLRNGIILKTSSSNSGGYPMVILSVNGERYGRYIHGMVTEAFLGACPEGQEVRHKDGDESRPVLSNLEYGSSGDNKHDQVTHGTHPEASRDSCDNGHAYTPASTRIDCWPDGSFKARVCRACIRDRVKAWAARQPADDVCSEEGCNEPRRARKLCTRHYGQQIAAPKRTAARRQSLLRK